MLPAFLSCVSHLFPAIFSCRIHVLPAIFSVSFTCFPSFWALGVTYAGWEWAASQSPLPPTLRPCRNTLLSHQGLYQTRSFCTCSLLPLARACVVASIRDCFCNKTCTAFTYKIISRSTCSLFLPAHLLFHINISHKRIKIVSSWNVNVTPRWNKFRRMGSRVVKANILAVRGIRPFVRAKLFGGLWKTYSGVFPYQELFLVLNFQYSYPLGSVLNSEGFWELGCQAAKSSPVCTTWSYVIN